MKSYEMQKDIYLPINSFEISNLEKTAGKISDTVMQEINGRKKISTKIGNYATVSELADIILVIFLAFTENVLFT